MGEFRVVLQTDRYDESQRFYRDVLGWPLVREWDEASRGCLFGAGPDAGVELLEGAPAAPGSTFVAIEFDDVRSLHDRVAAAGAPIAQELADQPWRHRNFAVLDPNGLRLVFFEELG